MGRPSESAMSASSVQASGDDGCPDTTAGDGGAIAVGELLAHLGFVDE